MRDDVEAWGKVFDEYLDSGRKLKARSQELRKLRHTTYTNGYADPDADLFRAINDLIPDFISKAVKSATAVAKREHVKADRIERVNIFTTDLRREIHGANLHRDTKRWLVDTICHKGLWSDIGVPDLPLSRRMMYVHKTGGGSTTIKEEAVRSWCQRAMAQVKTTPEEDIQKDLEELRRSMVGLGSSIDTAMRINDEAEVVVDRLVQLGVEVEGL